MGGWGKQVGGWVCGWGNRCTGEGIIDGKVENNVSRESGGGGGGGRRVSVFPFYPLF